MTVERLAVRPGHNWCGQPGWEWMDGARRHLQRYHLDVS